MGNIELKIDGETIKLNKTQSEQLRRGIVKESQKPEMPSSVQWGNFTLSVRKATGSIYPMLITSSVKYENGKYGYDLGKSDVVSFIGKLKDFATKVFPDYAAAIKSA